ncbi:hypothetical protein CURTO8I2_220055 [Curtobacterium sp. 8I-2]|nr:hypothetical protein CURTO8I2_220055 [Curtobacterium sp. 8I-2]
MIAKRSAAPLLVSNRVAGGRNSTFGARLSEASGSTRPARYENPSRRRSGPPPTGGGTCSSISSSRAGSSGLRRRRTLAAKRNRSFAVGRRVKSKVIAIGNSNLDGPF